MPRLVKNAFAIALALLGFELHALAQVPEYRAALEQTKKTSPARMLQDELTARGVGLAYLERTWNQQIEALQTPYPAEADAVAKRSLEILRGIDDISRRLNGRMILVGHQLYRDGKNFELASRTAVGPLLGSPHLILRDTNAIELYAILLALPTDSIDELLYFGHGSPNVMYTGPKNLLLPYDWHDQLTISEIDFLYANPGSIYDAYLAPLKDQPCSSLGGALNRVLNQKANVCLRGCNLGNEFAPKLNTVLESEHCTMEACMGPMEFTYLKGGECKNPGDFPVPENADLTFMIPSPTVAQLVFGGTNWVKIEKSLPLGTLTNHAPNAEPATSKEGINEPYHFILSRLILGSADRTFLSTSAPVVLFTVEENMILSQLFGRWMEKNRLKAFFGDREFSRVYEAHPEHRALLDKVHTLVQDSRRLYYKPIPPDAVLKTEALKKSLGTLR